MRGGVGDIELAALAVEGEPGGPLEYAFPDAPGRGSASSSSTT